MTGEAVYTIWGFLATIFFFSCSILGATLLMTLAIWKLHDLYMRLKKSDGAGIIAAHENA